MKVLTVNSTMTVLMLQGIAAPQVLATGNGPATLPPMQMHIFRDPPSDMGQAPAEPDRTKPMTMVVFSDGEGVETYPTETSGENLRLDYVDGSVAVSSEAAEAEPALDELSTGGMVVRFHAQAGYRQDKLYWTIAAPDGTPNILSELTWDNIESITFDVGGKVKTESNWVLEGGIVYGEIIDGNNQDSDFFDDNRTQEFSRSNNDASDGNVVDLSLGLGYQFDIGHWRDGTPVWSLLPKVGASYHTQNFNVTHGVQTIPATGNFPAVLDSTYEANWYGPWAGLYNELNFTRYVQFWNEIQVHYAYYEATADWNLREDFQHPKSFAHEAEGTGIVARTGGRFFIYDDLFMDLSITYNDWEADKKGIDTVYFADGSTVETRFNGVNWQSLGAAIGIHYDF